MGELPFFRARSALHPDHLWIWERSVYVDENQRTWLPIIIEVQPLWGRRGWAWAAASTRVSLRSALGHVGGLPWSLGCFLPPL